MAAKGIPYLAERIEFIETALATLLRDLELASGPRRIALEKGHRRGLSRAHETQGTGLALTSARPPR